MPAETDAFTCLLCGYSLAGLPDVGRCPECGRGYDLPQRRAARLGKRNDPMPSRMVVVAIITGQVFAFTFWAWPAQARSGPVAQEVMSTLQCLAFVLPMIAALVQSIALADANVRQWREQHGTQNHPPLEVRVLPLLCWFFLLFGGSSLVGFCVAFGVVRWMSLP